MGALCRLQKRRSKRYPACSDVKGAVKINIFPLPRKCRRTAAAPSRNSAQRLRLGSEEQQNERTMSFVMKLHAPWAHHDNRQKYAAHEVSRMWAVPGPRAEIPRRAVRDGTWRYLLCFCIANEKARRKRYDACDELVPVTGLEPVRCRQRWILSPLRLPIPSHRQIGALPEKVRESNPYDTPKRRRLQGGSQNTFRVFAPPHFPSFRR